MTFEDLQTLLDFHYGARDRVLDAVDALTDDQYTRDLADWASRGRAIPRCRVA